MDTKEVFSQEEFDSIPDDFNGRILIKFGSNSQRAVVKRKFEYARVVAYGTSFVVACENSSVKAWENSQTCRMSEYASITVCGNAREVTVPNCIEEYATFYGLPITDGNILLYKAVHKSGESYVSDYGRSFEYVVGQEIVPSGFDSSTYVDCGEGIHASYKEWAVNYGANWDDLAILELEFDIRDIVVPLYTDGKVRGKKAKVIREVPLTECGLLGEQIERRRGNAENTV